MTSNKHLGKGLYLGQVVRFTKVLERQTCGSRRWWKENSTEETSGIVIGLRTLQTGYIENDGEYGSYWYGRGDTPCVLVAVDIYKNPVRVPYEHILRRQLGLVEVSRDESPDAHSADASLPVIVPEATPDGGSSL